MRTLDLAEQADGTLDGIHMDSTSGMRRWGSADDYHRPHWAGADIPLTFSYESGMVTQRLAFPVYSHLRDLANSLHERGKILSANHNASEARSGAYFGADVVDYFGIERGLEEKAGVHDPFVTVDSYALFKRSLAYQRPISAYDYLITSNRLSLGDVESRLQQSLFYDIFVGTDGRALSKGPLGTPAGRAVYGKYTPIFRSLAAAGWEPVTNARSSNPNVWVERYGYVSTSSLHLALRDETGREQTYTLTIEMDQDGATSVRGASATEQVSGRRLPVQLDATGTTATITATIAPKSTQVIRLDAQPQS